MPTALSSLLARSVRSTTPRQALDFPEDQPISFTLWRGTELLGELRVREHSTSEFSAVMLPVVRNGLAGLMQTRLDSSPSAPVFQHPIDPFVVAGDVDAVSSHTKRVRGKRLTGEDAQGIPADRQLCIRDETGALLTASMILLTEFRLSARVAATTFPELSPSAVDRDRAWMVLAVLEDGAPAT